MDDSAQYREDPQTAQNSLVPVQSSVIQPLTVQPHSAGLAVIASFFVPGLGSMLNDKVGKGILILSCSVLACISIMLVVGLILSPAVWIWGMVAANNDARSWNRAHGIIN